MTLDEPDNGLHPLMIMYDWQRFISRYHAFVPRILAGAGMRGICE